MLNPSCSTIIGLDPFCDESILNALQESYLGAVRFCLKDIFLPIIQFLLPEQILENFELTSIDRQDGVFHVHSILWLPD
jgi:hypothetical protein